MKLLLESFFALSAVRSVLSQGTDLGGGVVTRTDVEYLADLSLDVRDMAQTFGADGGSNIAMSIYMNGQNSEPQTGSKYKLTQLSTELGNIGVAKATPNYLFHLYGISERSTDLNKLAEKGVYADDYIRSAIMAGREHAPRAVLVLSMWMYATHVLYDGIMTCQKKLEADNPSQFDLKGGGLDKFIALWIGMGQTHGSEEGNSLYALAEEADSWVEAGEDNDLNESLVNKRIKLLYQEGASLLSFPAACTKENPNSAKKLWSVVSRIIPQMHIPLLQMLIRSILEKDELATQMYALAVVPQAAQCRASKYKRLRDHLLTDFPKFDKTDIILKDLYDIYSCFGLTCEDVGDISGYDFDIPDCVAAVDDAPMAQYRPTTAVHPIARMDLDVLQIRILTSLDSFDFAKFWYIYGRNSPVQVDSENDAYAFYSLAQLAVSRSRRNAEPTYTEFVRYFNDPNYADTVIRDTFDGIGKWDSTKSVAQRSAVIAETCAFQILYIHLIAQINDAVKKCTGIESEGDEDYDEYDLTHPWDEVAALLIGSLEGTEEGGSTDVQDGQLIWGLNQRRGFQFQTLNGKGYSKLNSQFEDLLFAGRGEIDAMDCDAFEKTAEKIKLMTLIPLMQSVMRYAVENEKLTADSNLEDLALGEVYALAIIPIVESVDPGAAAILEENMIFENGIDPVRDGSQAVADAIGSAAVSRGIRCSLLGSTYETKPCRFHRSSAQGLRPLLFSSIAAAVSFIFMF